MIISCNHINIQKDFNKSLSSQPIHHYKKERVDTVPSSQPPLWILLISAVLLLIFIWCPQIRGQEEKTKIIAAAIKNWPPHYITDSETGNISGFAIDIMDSVAELSGLIVQYKIYDSWPKAMKAIENKEVDVLPNVGFTSERESIYHFTPPVETARISCFVRETSTLQTLDDLSNHTVGVVSNNKGFFLMKKRGGAKLTVYPSIEQAFVGLISGAVEALVYPEPIVLYMAHQLGVRDQIRIFGTPLLELKRGLAVMKENTALYEKLDKAVIRLLASDKYQSIYSKWYKGPDHYWNTRKVGILIGIILVPCIFVLMVWRYISIIGINSQLKKSIKERELAETALKESEEKYSLLTEHASDGVVLIQNEAITFANQTMEELTGYTVHQLIEKPLSEIISSEYQTLITAENQNKKAGPSMYELVVQCHDGSQKPVELSTRSIQYEGESALIALFRDISERKRVEEEKANLKAKLQQTYKMEAIGTLAGGIAHDFNNALGIIIGYSEMISSDITEPELIEEYLKEVLNASTRAKELVRQILSFSRKEEQKPISIAPHNTINEAMKMMRATIPTTIDIEMNIDSDCGNILADPTKIQQVVMNLITNAVHAMDEKGSIRIKLDKTTLERSALKHRPDMIPGEYVQLSVSDAGCGMAPDIMERIFEPFFTTKELGKGTGLGLSVIHGIIRDHHGLITVDSKLKKGTTFTIYLAVSDTENKEMPSGLGPLPRGTEHILLVDDEEALITLGTLILKELGYKVSTTTSSLEALAIFKANPNSFDLIISDQAMPKLSGIELIEKVLAIRADIPVILCSGYPTKLNEKNKWDNKGRKILIKPVSKSQLAFAVRETIESHE